MQITPCCPYCAIDLNNQKMLEIYGYPFNPG
jgi:hypothetical protein